MPSVDVSRYLKRKPIRLAGHEPAPKLDSDNLSGQKFAIRPKQLANKKKEGLYVELSTLLAAGIDLRNALDLILTAQLKAKDLSLFQGIRLAILAGHALSQALRDTGKFSEYEYYSIQIGEETGRIAEVLAELAQYFKRRIQQRRKLIAALTYPALVLSTSMGAVIFMLKFVVPMFANVFLRFGGQLPWITAKIIGVSQWFDRYLFVLIFLLLMVFVWYWFKRKSLFYRQYSSELILRCPVAGDLVRKIYLARFANTMRLLVSTDTPLLRSISLVRQMIDYYPIESTLVQVEQGILKGESLHESLAVFNFYPPKFIQLIKVGEEINRLDHFFDTIATQYTDEVEYRTNSIGTVLEPIIIIFLGLVVGLILIAMYLPMFQMSNSF